MFLEKIRPKLVVLQSRKKLQVLEKKIFPKKLLPAYLCRYDLQNGMRKCFLKKLFSRYLSFSDFKVPKNRSTINQENFALCFGDYLTNHLVKFLQDKIKPWRAGSLRVYTGYHFF